MQAKDALEFFQALVTNKTREYLVARGTVKNPDGMSFTEMIAIAKLICQVASVICPLIQDM